MDAAIRFHPGTLAALHEVSERRGNLIEELGQARSLSRIRLGSLIDILTIGSFDDCCCGPVNAKAQGRIIGWPSYRLRDNVKKELRRRLTSDALYEGAIEDAFDRGF
ncbi:hypothetical protein N7E02_08240 [Aliirhizobium terrae]|uniref:hypothetical protein n=1 Tax=Terrirhizobium terrae TaxID=2926709 RepID=UPI0025759AD7|nr:hypothetical protein [Rhizobium sp. CC-CFT758]WJH40594.1 hypothetical protein N7E02_08240 [Rhizobium sp. CC-CFT758]